jgi:hypothetical protein
MFGFSFAEILVINKAAARKVQTKVTQFLRLVSGPNLLHRTHDTTARRELYVFNPEDTIQIYSNSDVRHFQHTIQLVVEM